MTAEEIAEIVESDLAGFEAAIFSSAPTFGIPSSDAFYNIPGRLSHGRIASC